MTSAIKVIKDVSVFTKTFFPTAIKHREEQIKNLEYLLLKELFGNAIVYGLSGTGKTLCVRSVADRLNARDDIKIIYVKLREARTEYSAINTISKSLGLGDQKGHLSTTIYSSIYEFILKSNQRRFLFILDEVDGIKQDYSAFLDFFLRPEENVDLNGKEMAVVFISNKITFPQNLDAGMKSSFACIDKIIFPPYNADQLRDILYERAAVGLYEGAYGESIVPYCAAIAAQEHGDARRAIQLLGKAAAISEKSESNEITESHVRKAIEIIEFEGATNIIRTLPLQSKAMTLAIAKDVKKREKKGDSSPTTTSAIYMEYKNIVSILGIPTLTQRRITDILTEFDALGLIKANIVFRGRMGRWKEVELDYPAEVIEKAVTEDIRFEVLKPATVQSKLGK